MKDEYDFSKAKRVGRITEEPPLEPGKLKITIRLDQDIVDYFAREASKHGVPSVIRL